MNPSDIARLRLGLQRLIGPPFETARAAVEWLGAVQAQDYAGAKWALGQRTKDVTDAALDRVFDRGGILRTHVMRPTWHFVAPRDLRWLLELTAPRVHAANAFMYRKLELDAAVFRRSHDIIARALAGHRHLTRSELSTRLHRAKIVATGHRLSYLMMHAEIEGLICSGPRRGKQFTYALVDERVAPVRRLTRERALAELTRRYFTSHGPALLEDFVWWSGLTVAEARAGIEGAAQHLASEVIDGNIWWFADEPVEAARRIEAVQPIVRLLPNYDESLMYRRRTPLQSPIDRKHHEAVLAVHILTVNGHVAGGWRREVRTRAMTVEVTPLRTLDEAERDALNVEAERYARFLAMPVTAILPGLQTRSSHRWARRR